MYNGIGLQTPRGSGTSGHVQRNWAFIRKKEKTSFKEDGKAEKEANRLPNQDILDHAKKRKIEVKCAEFAEILESQGLTEEEVEIKVDEYRKVLLKNDKKVAAIKNAINDDDEEAVVQETHHIAAAQQEKNARIRSAFGISETFVDGTSFDPERKAREAEEKAELRAQKAAKAKEAKEQAEKKYALLKTPSPSPDKEVSPDENKKVDKKHKRKRSHSESRKSKKSKKHKKVKKHKKDK